jgi:hypothetical protein
MNRYGGGGRGGRGGTRPGKTCHNHLSFYRATHTLLYI